MDRISEMNLLSQRLRDFAEGTGPVAAQETVRNWADTLASNEPIEASPKILRELVTALTRLSLARCMFALRQTEKGLALDVVMGRESDVIEALRIQIDLVEVLEIQNGLAKDLDLHQGRTSAEILDAVERTLLKQFNSTADQASSRKKWGGLSSRR